MQKMVLFSSKTHTSHLRTHCSLHVEGLGEINALHPKCSFSYCLQCEDYYYTIYHLTCLTIEKGQG